jgi:hypothetical protein
MFDNRLSYIKPISTLLLASLSMLKIFAFKVHITSYLYLYFIRKFAREMRVVSL